MVSTSKRRAVAVLGVNQGNRISVTVHCDDVLASSHCRDCAQGRVTIPHPENLCPRASTSFVDLVNGLAFALSRAQSLERKSVVPSYAVPFVSNHCHLCCPALPSTSFQVFLEKPYPYCCSWLQCPHLCLPCLGFLQREMNFLTAAFLVGPRGMCIWFRAVVLKLSSCCGWLSDGSASSG